MGARATESVSVVAQAYIQGLGACAVYVVGSDLHGLAQFGFSIEPARTLAKIAGSTSVQPLQDDLFFASSEDTARLLCAAIDDTMRRSRKKRSGRWWSVGAGTLTEIVAVTAQTHAVQLVTRHAIETRAKVIARHVGDRIEAMRRAGALHELNQAYKAHRASAASSGERSLSYPAWLEQRTAAIVKNLAASTGLAAPIALPATLAFR